MSGSSGDPDRQHLASRDSAPASDARDPGPVDESRRAALLEKIGRFPTSPGVYVMRDARKRTIYVGKAVNLRSRVRSYFLKSSDTRIFHRHLVERIDDIDCIVTASESEALLLENNLIKKRRPLFNIRLRDDKSYLCLKVTLSETWPRVRLTRRYQNDGDVYFGPFGSARSVREMLRVIKSVFPLRTCTNGFFATRKRPCIEHDIGRCTAPCVDLIDHERYMEDVEEVILFLRGQNQRLIAILQEKMRAASDERHFELAARYRDQIRAIERVFEVQKAQTIGKGDLDVFGSYRHGDTVAIHEIVIRDGKMVNSAGHDFQSSLEDAEVFASFIAQYYLRDRYIPRVILAGIDFPEREIVTEWLSEKRGAKVELLVPQRGEKRRLVEMAIENARNFFDVARTRGERTAATLGALGKALGLAEPPHRIECYDISNFQGRESVGSMVVFEGGRPERSQYRKYRIKTVEGADDFQSLREVLDRRLQRLEKEPQNRPDLIVIDGGKGQLGAVREILSDRGHPDLGLISLAKSRHRKGTFERIFLPGRPEPLPLAQDSPESLLIQHIRDEAHRFAIRYHRELRKKSALRTGLEGIPGVGPKRRRQLLDRFGTLRSIREASPEELAEVVGETLAARVRDWLHGDE